jgi:hypothetical protein
MWTGLKENSEYTAQITPYRNKVHAEIISKKKSRGYYDKFIDAHITIMDKTFGGFFSRYPKEKDYTDANKWVEEQLSLINSYGTVIVTEPEYLTR